MESVVTVRIGKGLFGIPIRMVRWIVDIEEVFSVPMMPEYVLGEIEHNGYLYFLVCLHTLLQKTSCERELKGKNALIIAAEGKEFAIVVDAIEKIDELERVRNVQETVSFVKDKASEDVVEVLQEPFFAQLHEIPTMRPNFKKQQEFLLQTQKKDEEERSFLLFSIGEQLFALDAAMVEFVEVIEDAKKGVATPPEPFLEGVYIVKKRLMYLLHLARFLKIGSPDIANILVVKKDTSYLGIGVGEIHNIVAISHNELSFTKADAKSCCFFSYDDQIVTVFNDTFVRDLCDRYSIISHKKEHQIIKDTQTQEFVVIGVADTQLAIPLDEIDSLHEMRDVHITRSLEAPNLVEGIVAIGAASYLLFDLEKMLHVSVPHEESLILVLHKEEGDAIFRYALRVGEICQIIQADVKNIYLVDANQEQFIKGTMQVGKKVYNILNTKWIIQRLKEEHEK